MKVKDFTQPRTMTLTVVVDQKRFDDWHWTTESHLSGDVINGMLVSALAEGDLIRHPHHTEYQALLGDLLAWHSRDGMFDVSWPEIKEAIVRMLEGSASEQAEARKLLAHAWHSMPQEGKTQLAAMDSP